MHTDIVEELGSGMRKMFKYTPLYANGKEPIIEEQDVYRIEIPYIPTLQGSDVDQELAELCGLTSDGIKYNIRKLREKGIIKRIGPDKGGHWEVVED